MNIRVLIFTNEKDAQDVLKAIDEMQHNKEFMSKAMALFSSIQKKTVDDEDLR